MNDLDEQDNRQWYSLNPGEQSNLYLMYGEHGKYFTAKSRALSDLIFNWLFILNSGGLVCVVTIFTSAYDTPNLTLAKWMGLSFIGGLFLIFLATKLQQYQADKKGKVLDADFDLLKFNKITVGQYIKNTYADVFPYDLLITSIEFLSLFAFFLGFILGFFALQKLAGT